MNCEITSSFCQDFKNWLKDQTDTDLKDRFDLERDQIDDLTYDDLVEIETKLIKIV